MNPQAKLKEIEMKTEGMEVKEVEVQTEGKAGCCSIL